MSWRDFDWLIKSMNTDVTAWMDAIRANPNTPEDALKVALLEMIQREDGEMLERLTRVVIDIVRNADAMLTALVEREGFPPVVDSRPVVVVSPTMTAPPDWDALFEALPEDVFDEDWPGAW